MFLIFGCYFYAALYAQEALAYVGKMLAYENSTYGIRIQYPSNWHKENVSSSDKGSTLVDVVKFVSPANNASDMFPASLDLKIDEISDIQPITLAKYANNSIEDLRKDFDIVMLDRNASLSDNPAYKLLYTGVEEGVNLQAMLILTIKGDKAYILNYIAEPTKFSYYLPTLQKMIDSLQITSQENGPHYSYSPNWMDLCNKISLALISSCDTLVNPDNTLTSAGVHARNCIQNGALLTGGAFILGTPPTAIVSALPFAAKLFGCGDVVNISKLTLGQLSGLGSIFR